jgi:hypothetical protein
MGRGGLLAHSGYLPRVTSLDVSNLGMKDHGRPDDSLFLIP